MQLNTTDELFCPFPCEINPQVTAAHEHMLEWASNFGLIEGLQSSSSRLNFAWLAARVHPNAPLEALQIATEWICWLFCGDDVYDESAEGRAPVEMERGHANLLSVLAGASPTERDSMSVYALADLRDRLLRCLSPEAFGRFYRGVEAYLAAVRWEAENRASGTVPSPATYCKMRLDTSACYPCFDLIEITEGVALPEIAYAHPHTQKMGRVANNVVSWCNDIISVHKELEHGDVHNLVIVLHNHQRASFQEAMAEAIGIHNAEVRTFLDLESRLPSFEAKVNRALQSHVRGLKSWMRGNMDWARATGRYAPPAVSHSPSTTHQQPAVRKGEVERGSPLVAG
jgi:5-epi-alpha-selinene synthase